MATTLNNLASLYESMGAYEKALPLYERSLEIKEVALGKGHPSIATTRHVTLTYFLKCIADTFYYNPALPYNFLMIFIETSIFTKLLSGYFSDEEYRCLQSYLLQKPDAGDIVRGTGGVRKVRWAQAGKGKSGGVRVIYYWKKNAHEIWLLTLYSKSERATLPSHVLKQIAEAIEHE
ncbi:Toxin HigB-2 [Candidatus Venteria ishoeyi]|uniref:Toxin HigB-2 n=1 Tax=Candidatus Venteria ishoeyi TaxID=1899563 RepID=A0A1H6FHH2_9GAMM|nr:Toxin HigB-2 [Candidatus Venteria ishoeyi]